MPNPFLPPFYNNRATYLDGLTGLERLERLERYIDRALIPDMTDAVEAVIDSSIVVQEPVINGVMLNPASEVRTTLETLFNRNDGRVIHTGPRTRAGVLATLDAAEAKGPYTKAYFPGGAPYELDTGISMSGRTALPEGAGSGGWDSETDEYTGTIFKASTQDGPVIDFTGWVHPVGEDNQGFTNKVSIGNFGIVGSGVADPSKDNAGIRLTKMSSVYFHDITVRNTGGPGWQHMESPGDAVYLCDFERIVVTAPISAQTNDVPYFELNESNGCRFRSCGIRSPRSANDCGVSGAVIVKSNSAWTGYDILFDGFWIEFIHVPANGSIINITSNKTHFRDTGWHDISRISGAANTAYFRLNPPTAQNFGGNIISGLIPGSSGELTEVEWGVDVLQPRNRIEGVKGYSGKNVRIGAGIGYTTINLGGAEASATGVAVTDNSGEPTNVVRDDVIQDYRTGTYKHNPIDASVGGAGPRFTDAADATKGAIWLGNASVRLQAIGANAYFTANELHVRTPDFTPMPIWLRGGSGGLGIVSHTGNPNGSSHWVSRGTICLCTDGTVWIKNTGDGDNTGWLQLATVAP